jgi:hypothetical protein
VANLRVPLASQQDLTSEFFNTSIDDMWSVAFQASDNSTTSNVAIGGEVYSTDLTLPMASSGIYIFQSCLFYDTPAAADISIKISTPFVNAGYVSPWSSGTAITGVTNNIDQSATDTLATSGLAYFFSCGGVASGTVMSIRPYGYFAQSTSSGYMRIAHQQVTTSTSQTILKQGSWIALSRVG